VGVAGTAAGAAVIVATAVIAATAGKQHFQIE
jgi:hypothetical protein